MHIIVLGGAGAMGRITVRTLTEYDDVDQITIADYNEVRAQEVASTLNSSKIRVQQIDVNNAGAAGCTFAWSRCRIECCRVCL